MMWLLFTTVLGATATCTAGPGQKCSPSLTITFTGTVVATTAMNIEKTDLTDDLVALTTTTNTSGELDAGEHKDVIILAREDTKYLTVVSMQHGVGYSTTQHIVAVRWWPNRPLPSGRYLTRLAIAFRRARGNFEPPVMVAAVVRFFAPRV